MQRLLYLVTKLTSISADIVPRYTEGRRGMPRLCRGFVPKLHCFGAEPVLLRYRACVASVPNTCCLGAEHVLLRCRTHTTSVPNTYYFGTEGILGGLEGTEAAERGFGRALAAESTDFERNGLLMMEQCTKQIALVTDVTYVECH